jgi:Spy/CpxP family protein refolding chaperone
MAFYRKFAAAFAAAFLVAGLGSAQAQKQAAPSPAAPQATAPDEGLAAGEKAAKKLGLQPKELDQIEKILDRNEEAIGKARAEIQILQARITRLLLEKEPPMDQVKALVKESLDWELQVRMAQIERQIAIRKVVGEERWAGVMKLMRGPLARAGKALKQAAAGKEAAILQRVQSMLERLR